MGSVNRSEGVGDGGSGTTNGVLQPSGLLSFVSLDTNPFLGLFVKKKKKSFRQKIYRT